MKLPVRYEDLTVDQFQKLEALKSQTELELIDRAAMKLTILSGESIDHIESLHPNTIFEMLTRVMFLNEPIHSIPVNDQITLGKKKFQFIKDIAGYTVAQRKDFNEFIKQAHSNYISCLPEILAICHTEQSSNEYKYLSEKHFENVELFRNAKLKDVIGAVFFYSNFLKSSLKTIQICMEESEKVISEHVKEMTNDLEFQTFLKDGGMSTGSVK